MAALFAPRLCGAIVLHWHLPKQPLPPLQCNRIALAPPLCEWEGSKKREKKEIIILTIFFEK
jgi:hypothetical protein